MLCQSSDWQRSHWLSSYNQMTFLIWWVRSTDHGRQSTTGDFPETAWERHSFHQIQINSARVLSRAQYSNFATLVLKFYFLICSLLKQFLNFETVIHWTKEDLSATTSSCQWDGREGVPLGVAGFPRYEVFSLEEGVGFGKECEDTYSDSDELWLGNEVEFGTEEFWHKLRW